MNDVAQQIRDRAERRKDKIEKHLIVKADLEREYSLLTEGERKDRVGQQLLTTLLKIESHKSAYKAYNKAADMIEQV